MKIKDIFTALALGIATLAPLDATAGSSAAANPVLPAADVATFANRVQRDLASRGANVAIVSRVGRDPSVLPDGINYTHVRSGSIRGLPKRMAARAWDTGSTICINKTGI